MTAARELAQLAFESVLEDASPLFIGTVTAITATTVTVRPDSAFDGALAGPMQLAGTTTLAVNDRVLCCKAEDGSMVCLGKFL